MLRAPHPRFTVDVEHGESLNRSGLTKPVAAVELPTGTECSHSLFSHIMLRAINLDNNPQTRCLMTV